MSQMTNETFPPWPSSCALPICKLPLIEILMINFRVQACVPFHVNGLVNAIHTIEMFEGIFPPT
jgi:hypothetical protein